MRTSRSSFTVPADWTEPSAIPRTDTPSPFAANRTSGCSNEPRSVMLPLDEPAHPSPPGSRASLSDSPAKDTSRSHGNGGEKPYFPVIRTTPLPRRSSARSKRASSPRRYVPFIRAESKGRP